MNFPRITSLIAVALLTTSADLPGQQDSVVAVGDKVRISAPEVSDTLLVGVLNEASADTLVLSVEGRTEPVKLPFASVQGLEVRGGKKSMSGTLSLIGGVIGAVTGAVLGYSASTESCKDDMGQGSLCGAGVGLHAGVVGIAGMAIGGLVGLTIRSDRWEDVPLDQIQLGWSPLIADGVGITASIRF